MKKITILLLVLAISVPVFAGVPSEVDQVLATFKNVSSVEQAKSLLFTDMITVWDASALIKAVSLLPLPLQKHQVTKGKEFTLAKKVFDQVLALHGRTGKVALYVHSEDVDITLWRGCVLLVPKRVLEACYDAELAGIFSHELGHAYFEDEMFQAKQSGDVSAMRRIELKCDAVALVSLKMMLMKPERYLVGLKRLQEMRRRKGLSESILQTHPDLVVRGQFLERFTKMLSDESRSIIAAK